MMRPHRYVGPRSRCRVERLYEALEPASFDPDPFDPPDEPWRPTTTEDTPTRPRRPTNRETTR
jgi:hypothetical protein